MFILGHLAVALAAHRTLRLTLLIVVLATFLPDLIDKPLFYAGLTSHGRMAAHSLWAWAGGSILVLTLTKSRTGVAYSVGYLGHLVADLVTGSVPWLWPLVPVDAPGTPFTLGPEDFQRAMRDTFVELPLLVAVALWVYQARLRKFIRRRLSEVKLEV